MGILSLNGNKWNGNKWNNYVEINGNKWNNYGLKCQDEINTVKH
jgi:hypothetical protein